MKIEGKCVLITGGAKRCGAELVKSFASDGAEVIIHCNTSTEVAEELLATLPGKGHRIIAADFSTPDGVAEFISRIINHIWITPTVIPGRYHSFSKGFLSSS